MPGNIINITPAEIAAWPKPNYVDPVERIWLTPFSATLFVVSTAMVVLRFWLRVGRSKQSGGLGLDDALLAAAWLASAMFTTVENLCASHYHMGRHVWDIPVDNYQYLLEMAWIAELAFLLCGSCTKISVLLFYRRLVEGAISRRWKWAVIVAIIFTSAYTLAFILALIFNCNPTYAYWKAFSLAWNETHSYSCVNTAPVNLLAGVCAAVSDLYSIILPMIMTRHFDLPRRSRVALNLLFSLGFLVVGASAVRTYYLQKLSVTADVTWWGYYAFAWGELELQLGIMCASAPALRVLFRRYFSPHRNRVVCSRLSFAQPEQNERPDSWLSAQSVRRTEEPKNDFSVGNDLNHRDMEKHVSNLSCDEITDSDIASATSPSTAVFAPTKPFPLKTSGSGFEGYNATEPLPIRSPEDYEAYNLQAMERYRATASASPSRSRSRMGGAVNFSQPLTPRPWDATSGTDHASQRSSDQG